MNDGGFSRRAGKAIRASQRRKKKNAAANEKKAASQNYHDILSAAQQAPEGKVANDSGFGFKEDREGIPCPVKGCSAWLTGSLNDVIAHKKDVHGIE